MRGVQTERLAKALGDPLRVRILSRLIDGPSTVSDVVTVTGAGQPNVSNHLAVLRRAGLVRAARSGRHMHYELAGPESAQLVEAILTMGGPPGRPATPSPIAEARTCYDHLAGKLGVQLLGGLMVQDALARPGSEGAIDLGPDAARVFERLGVDPSRAAQARRRRFAFACLDWTERRPHLGGALGAEVYRRFVEAGWVVPQTGTRAVLPTSGGRRALHRLGIV
jgi:DNA-binding transcriptional ArsR family regulator